MKQPKKEKSKVLPFKVRNNRKNIGDLKGVVDYNPFVDTNETKSLNIDDYKSYIESVNRGESAFPDKANIDLSRALNQSNWEQAGNAIARLIPNTALEILNQTGALLDFEDYINQDKEIGNWLSTWAQESKEKIDEALPIFQENTNEALQVGDFAWWMENGTNLVQSASAFATLGYATGGLSLASLTKGTQALKWLKTLGKTSQLSNTAKQGVQAVSALSSAALLNHAEGYGIATNVFDTVYNDTLAKIKSRRKYIKRKSRSIS